MTLGDRESGRSDKLVLIGTKAQLAQRARTLDPVIDLSGTSIAPSYGAMIR